MNSVEPPLPPLLPPVLPQAETSIASTKVRLWPWLVFIPLVGVGALTGMILAAPSVVTVVRTRLLADDLKRHVDAGTWQAGLAQAARGLPQVQPDARIFFALENLHFAANDLEQTKHFARRTLELEPDNEMAARLVVTLCRDFDDNETAYRVAKNWIARNDHGADIYKDLAMAADDAGHDDESLGYATIAFRRKPANPRVAGVYFYYSLLQNGADGVLPEVLRWASRHYPDEFFWAQVGKGLSETKQYREALVYLRCALAMGSTDQGVVTEMLDSYRGLGDAAGAKEFVESYRQSHPLNALIWRTLGAVQYDAADYANALDSFRMAQRLDPDHAITITNLVFTLVDLQRAADALAEGEAWLARDRALPTALFQRAMGNASFALSRWAEAERYYRAALALDPAQLSAARDLISTLLKLGRAGDAVAFGARWAEEHGDAVDKSFTETLEGARKRVGAAPAQVDVSAVPENAG
jgi:tetratricopeptide (TPR) repeat protein